MTQDTLMERETTIRWDETGEHAVLWTATPAVRKEWQSYGFPVKETTGGWRTEVPRDRITYKPIRAEKTPKRVKIVKDLST